MKQTAHAKKIIFWMHILKESYLSSHGAYGKIQQVQSVHPDLVGKSLQMICT